MPVENTRVRVRSSARAFATLSAVVLLTACGQTTSLLSDAEHVAAPVERRDMIQYRALPDERFPVPAVAAGDLDPNYARQQVRYATTHPVGTIVVDPDAKFLYLVMEGGTALRYGIGVGREGFGWSGTAEVARTAPWPRWTPPAAMVRRQPSLAPYRNGMEPGLDNPLGARALYLYQNGRDTLYRIHGTNEPWSIGQNVSSGCIRLLNQDIIDLFARVPVGARVVVLPHGPTAALAARVVDEDGPAARGRAP